jgi:hypothetical protein
MVDFNNPIVMEADIREFMARDPDKSIESESVLRTVAITKFWHALAGLYL